MRQTACLAQYLMQSRLTTLLLSLIARRLVRPQT